MKKIVIVSVGRELTKKERRSFSKDHPGMRLCFRLRYPNFLTYTAWGISLASIVISIMSMLK